MLSTWAEARAQAEVVDAEGDGGEEQAKQRRDGPVDGVVVQGGLHHLLHCGKQLASLEPVDRIVPEQTDGFVQEGQVPFEDGQLLEVEIDEMRVDETGTSQEGMTDQKVRRWVGGCTWI